MNIAGLLAAASRGDKAAVARLISIVERGGEHAREVVRRSPPTSGLYTVGITGAPGAGKSSLTDRLVGQARSSGTAHVGVIAVDPSSLFSGGAILGDRVRMQGHALDDGVFIRSMATRGHLGGLALAVPDALGILALAGVSIAFVETVGVGQVEVEVAAGTDTTVVVVTPGWGDSIQANKAGLLEVADLFVINKADRPGAAGTQRDLEMALDMSASFREGHRGGPGRRLSMAPGDDRGHHRAVQGHDGAAHGQSAGRDSSFSPGDIAAVGGSVRFEGDGRSGPGSASGSGVQSAGEASWRPPIVRTIAQTGEGVAELWNAIGEHRQYLEDRGLLELNRSRRVANRVRQILMAAMEQRVDDLVSSASFQEMAPFLASAEIDPYEAAERLMHLDRGEVDPSARGRR